MDYLFNVSHVDKRTIPLSVSADDGTEDLEFRAEVALVQAYCRENTDPKRVDDVQVACNHIHKHLSLRSTDEEISQQMFGWCLSVIDVFRYQEVRDVFGPILANTALLFKSQKFEKEHNHSELLLTALAAHQSSFLNSSEIALLERSLKSWEDEPPISYLHMKALMDNIAITEELKEN